MTNTYLLHHSALAAIAAALALSPTQAFAQDAATPPIVLPGEEVAAPIAAPVIIAPAPVAIPDAPIVSETRAAPAQPATATTRRATGIATPARATSNAAPAGRADIAPLNPAQPISPVVATAPLAEPMTADVATATVPDIAPTPTDSGNRTALMAQLLAGLLVAGAALAAFLALRRRRPTDSDDIVAPVIVERQPAYTPASVAEPVRAQPQVEMPQPAMATAAALPTAGAAVALPPVAPTDQTERTELLKKMVAARPDRANPFRSPKARLHRARLILQSLGRKFENARPRIDLSQYTSNWPALARHNRSAMA